MEKSCDFFDCMHEKLIIDHLILGICEQRIHEKLISQKQLDLQTAVDICKAMEAA